MPRLPSRTSLSIQLTRPFFSSGGMAIRKKSPDTPGGPPNGSTRFPDPALHRQYDRRRLLGRGAVDEDLTGRLGGRARNRGRRTPPGANRRRAGAPPWCSRNRALPSPEPGGPRELPAAAAQVGRVTRRRIELHDGQARRPSPTSSAAVDGPLRLAVIEGLFAAVPRCDGIPHRQKAIDVLTAAATSQAHDRSGGPAVSPAYHL
jgi:hypothetical protein